MSGAGTKTELSSTGRHVAFTTAGLLLVGAIFSSLAVLTFANLLLLGLLIEGMIFHRSVRTAKECLTVKSDPQTMTCTTGRRIELQKLLANDSNWNFRVTGLSLGVQAHLDEQEGSSEEFLLKRHERHTIQMRFECAVPGRFETRALKVNLTSRAHLFTQAIWAPDKTTLIARPPISASRLASIDSSLLDDLTPDPVSRGAGTDLAGIRASMCIKDLHRVDGKATARTGKFMVKEFYLERQPPIILLIDAGRTATDPRRGRSWISELLAALPNLLASFSPITPIGLVLYDEYSIVASISPRAGVYNRDLVLQTLLDIIRPETASAPIVEIHKEISTKNVATTTSTTEYQGILGPIFERMPWFYRELWLRRRTRLRRQGAFKAFTLMRNIAESLLIIGITDGKTNLDGLVEGARVATSFGHRIILALLTDHRRIPTAHRYPQVQEAGVKMLECLPEDLPAVLETTISRMSRERVIPSNLV